MTVNVLQKKHPMVFEELRKGFEDFTIVNPLVLHEVRSSLSAIEDQKLLDQFVDEIYNKNMESIYKGIAYGQSLIDKIHNN